jgi:peptidyl-prolyl cis-trans isomerase NIMA-interacting 1
MDLPRGWEERFSQTRQLPYYHNRATGETRWERPGAAAPPPAGPEHVHVLHLLVKHRDSRRPSSWRQDTITRSRAEALQLAAEYRDQVASRRVRFEDLAREYSDCSSAKHGGDLGPVRRGQMQRPFEDASFALGVEGLSAPVCTESGVHLILRKG